MESSLVPSASDKKLNRIVVLLSVPAFLSLVSCLYFWFRSYVTRDLFSSTSESGFKFIIWVIRSTVYLCVPSIATTLGALGCCLTLRKRSTVAPRIKLTATLVAISAAVALGIAWFLMPVIIPAP